MKKILLNSLVTISILSGFCLIFLISKKQTNDLNIEFLKKYGWEVIPQPIEKSEFTIPLIFDDVYKNYNELQKEASLDLIPYAGCSAVRYTYEVTNFPEPIDSQVRANIVTVDSKPIGGDISTVNINGFMYSLNFNTSTCFLTSEINFNTTEDF